MTDSDTIKQNAHKLADEIRKYCEDQKEIWQTLPYLALQADGVDGFSSDYQICYRYGYWRYWNNSPRGGFLGLSVDCSSGQLVNEPKSDHKKQVILATDKEVLTYATKPEAFDASEIAEYLKQKSQEEPGSWYTAEDNRRHQSKRVRLQAELGLAADKPFVRKQKAA